MKSVYICVFWASVFNPHIHKRFYNLFRALRTKRTAIERTLKGKSGWTFTNQQLGIGSDEW